MTHGPDAHETQDATEALWCRQERLLSALRSGATDDSGDGRYRDVFAALDREPLPALPDGFAVRVATDAQRLADARAQVSRFKTLLASLLSLLYLPAMLAATMLYWSRWPVASIRAPFGDDALSLWLIAIAVLGLSVIAVDALTRKASAGASG
ncbi:MAG: hypothetical protein HOP03_03005 [Lysobacter sp.]|nr:hypothetical protein [Lysobacter sp.]